MARRYDSRTTIFSPEGRLYQVEYAMEAVSHAGTCLGILASDGIVLAAERRNTNKLLDEVFSSEKIYKLNDDMVCAVAGITSDANVLTNELRLIAQRYLLQYGEPIPCEQLVSWLCDIKQAYTQYGDPSGNYGGWKATCIGSNSAAFLSERSQRSTLFLPSLLLRSVLVDPDHSPPTRLHKMPEMDSKHSMDTRYPIENGFSGDKAKSKELSNRQQLISFCSASIDNLNHMMAAVVTFYGMAYAVRDRNNISYNQAHIILTVVGYQMLMVESILIFRSNNGPAKDLNRNNRKLIHWILQLVGSVFAIAGSALQVYDREARLFTIHGITGFASMIITVLALVTSIPALYSQELRSAIKPNLSKFCHILFGLGSFVVGMVSLCYGMDKTGFKNWTSVGVAGWLIAFCAFTTIYATIMPLFNMFDRLRKSF